MTPRHLEWAEVERGTWRSLDGGYAIVKVTLNERPPRAVFHTRRIGEEMARAYPQRGCLGYLLGEHHSLADAQASADRDLFYRTHSFNVPEDHPAIALSPFWWPISEGTSRGALAVVQRDGRLVAQVLGMSRTTGDKVEPGEYTDIDLTALGLVPRAGADLSVRTDHPQPCHNCGAKPGQPHRDHCSLAVCQETGQQRLLCTYFGGSPAAGVEAVMSDSQAEFEEYFKTPTGHDCGEDIWQDAA